MNSTSNFLNSIIWKIIMVIVDILIVILFISKYKMELLDSLILICIMIPIILKDMTFIFDKFKQKYDI